MQNLSLVQHSFHSGIRGKKMSIYRILRSAYYWTKVCKNSPHPQFFFDTCSFSLKNESVLSCQAGEGFSILGVFRVKIKKCTVRPNCSTQWALFHWLSHSNCQCKESSLYQSPSDSACCNIQSSIKYALQWSGEIFHWAVYFLHLREEETHAYLPAIISPE